MCRPEGREWDTQRCGSKESLACVAYVSDVKAVIGLYAKVGRMRLISDRAAIEAAVRVEDTIIKTYLGPNRTFQKIVEFAHSGGMAFLAEFSEAARKDVAARVTAVR